MLAALMDSVISKGPLSADRQSGRRWQVKNTLLAKRLRRGPCCGNRSDKRLWDKKSRVGPNLLDLRLAKPLVCLQFELATILNLNLQRTMGMEGSTQPLS